jgi:hypothetical protein
MEDSHMAKDNPETPPAAPDPWTVLNRVAAAMEALAGAPKSDKTDALIATLTQTMARVSDNQLKGAELIANETRRSNRPSNEVVPNISVFNRRGVLLPLDAEGPRKQPLKCIMLIPWLAEWESLTREEVELLNLLEPGEYMLPLIDRSKVKMEVRVDYKVDGKTPHRLLMNNVGADGQPGTAFNNDNFRLIPPLSDMLRSILRQHSKEIRDRARAVLSDEEEEALIEAGELLISK